MNGRPYCRCTTVSNYNYDRAAEKLGCARRWLEDNINRLPHQKFGQSPAFCECELALIQAMSTVLPAGVLDLVHVDSQPEPEPGPETMPTVQSIRPSRSRSRVAC